VAPGSRTDTRAWLATCLLPLFISFVLSPSLYLSRCSRSDYLDRRILTRQHTFEPNMNWSHYYADGNEIQRYWRSLAEKYDCMKYIKLSHTVIEARWDEASVKWDVQVRDEIKDRVIKDTADILISSTGFLKNWKWPDIPGCESTKDTWFTRLTGRMTLTVWTRKSQSLVVGVVPSKLCRHCSRR
jgi:hypothetical protein